jgi:cellulose synthase (UDP-forming)
MLKIACWPVYLRGTLLALVRADIPYIPTAKQAVRGEFLRLAWPQLALIAVYIITVAHVAMNRMYETSEGRLELTSEGIWGMVAFATIPVLTSIGALYAAIQSSRRVAERDPWDAVDVARFGDSPR